MHYQTILVFSPGYLPGYKHGGPIRSLVNLVDRVGDGFDFKILTKNCDSGSSQPYPGIHTGCWQKVGNASVLYLSPRNLSLRNLRSIIESAQPDSVYLNSFFSPVFTIKPLILRRLNLVPKIPFIVAPRGEFAENAVAFKRFKKRLYMALAKLLGLYCGVTWHASSEFEKLDIQHQFDTHNSIRIAPNLVSAAKDSETLLTAHEKLPGQLKVVFLSRVSRMKNLEGALVMLKGVQGTVEFNIYGPVLDRAYWDACQIVIGSLPQNIRVQYRGAVAPDRVGAIMRDHDLFFLPTLGENFGHAILEALVYGCPVLISDQTPWRNLESQGVGWDLPLDRPDRFRAIFQQCLEMDDETHRMWSQKAMEFGNRYSRDEDVLEKNRALFSSAMNRGS